MAQKKLLRFAQIKTFPNVLEYPTGMKEKWNEFFKNENLITLELACGRGEYTVGLAALYPQQNFIGVDVKGNRMYIGAKKCLEENGMPQLISSFRILIRYGKAEVSRTIAFSSRQRFVRNKSRVNSE